MIKYIVWGTIITMLHGCMGGEPQPNSNTQPTNGVVQNKPVGIGINQIGQVEKYPNYPYGYYYYGQLLIEPKLSIAAVRGPESKELLEHVAELFHDHKKNFGLSVTPIIDGITLPDIILFSYSYDSSNNSWTTTLNENPRTGMILLKPTTELKFRFKYISINSRDFSKIAEITSLFNSGGWILSSVSKPMINMISGRISDILSDAVSTTVTNSFVPVGDAIKSINYQIKTKDAKELATVKFSVILSSSVVSGNIVEQNINTIPKADKFMNPLHAIKTNLNSNFTLYDDLNRVESLDRFSQIKDPDEFRDKCRNILNHLDTYGLNQFDKLNAFSQILDSTDFTRDPKLYTSGCLRSHEFQRLKEMQIPLDPPPPPVAHNIIIDADTLSKLVGYMKTPDANIGHKGDLIKLFSETVSISAQNTELNGLEDLSVEEYPTWITAQNIIERLGKIGIARACCYRFPNSRNSSLLFRPLGSTDIYRLTLSRHKSRGHITTIHIEHWDEEKISLHNIKRLKKAVPNENIGHLDKIDTS